MAGRTIWKGQIHFGDETVPVKLHTATREQHIQFHLLHKHDRVKLRQQMICAYEKKPVAGDEQVRGFEIEEGKYIIIDPDELEQTTPEESRLIDVHEFVTVQDIDPMLIERVYYLEADSNAKAYNTFAAVLKDLDAAGICTWTMRKRSYLGSVQANGKLLRLNTLRYADEIIPVKSLDLKKITLSEKELSIGGELIKQLTAPFQPGKFENEHLKELQSLIDRKAKGEKIVILRPKRVKPTKSDELLKVLQASLKKVA